VTYCVGYRSADVWDCDGLCVVLDWAVCGGGMTGCTVVHMVLILWFY
jgi:hypothetical protein